MEAAAVVMMLYRQASAPVQPRFQGGKGRNQELDRRLRTKADELERLFDEHKLRAHRGRKDENSVRSGDVLDFVRGEFYERYVEKRDAKLRKEWGARREERERKEKAMRESLERSSAELKASTPIRRSKTGMIIHRNPSAAVRGIEEDGKSSDSSCQNAVASRMPWTKRSTSSSTGRNSNSSSIRSIPRPSSKAPAASSVRTSDSNPSEIRTTVSSITRSKSSTPSQKPSLRAADDCSYSCVTDTTMCVDAAVPTGSSASGKSRKKWGSSPGSVKDGGKGITRLLHFGRKAKGTEGIMGESEGRGGSDIDNRTPATVKSGSEHQAKDRTIQLEQGSPRSFFSLPSFRNRGGESKLGR